MTKKMMMKKLIPLTATSAGRFNVNVSRKWFSDISCWLILAIIAFGLILTFSVTGKQKLNAATGIISNYNNIFSSQISGTSSLDTAFNKNNENVSGGFNMDNINIAKKMNESFTSASSQYVSSPKFQEMNQYMQHGTTTTLEHCMNVAKCSFAINRLLLIGANEKDLIEASLLHDFYLYDWHDGKPCRTTHGFDHPSIACDNATKYFDISETAQDAIECHMWPLNITHVPKTKVAVLVTIADKICAGYETIHDNSVKIMDALHLNNLQLN